MQERVIEVARWRAGEEDPVKKQRQQGPHQSFLCPSGEGLEEHQPGQESEVRSPAGDPCSTWSFCLCVILGESWVNI